MLMVGSASVVFGARMGSQTTHENHHRQSNEPDHVICKGKSHRASKLPMLAKAYMLL